LITLKGSLCLNENPISLQDEHPEDSFKLQDWTAINENIVSSMVSSPKQENKKVGISQTS